MPHPLSNELRQRVVAMFKRAIPATRLPLASTPLYPLQ
jgi:hypothetical protein